MVKYCGYYITFQEVPNEVALVFTISNCPYRCEGCHSPWLQNDIGDQLTRDDVLQLVEKYWGAVTCVCFMGTGGDPVFIKELVKFVRSFGLKTCVYTGGLRNTVEDLGFPDYFKEGPYIASLGGLDSRDTNQRMWRKNEDGTYNDITYLFWKKKQ